MIQRGPVDFRRASFYVETFGELLRPVQTLAIVLRDQIIPRSAKTLRKKLTGMLPAWR